MEKQTEKSHRRLGAAFGGKTPHRGLERNKTPVFMRIWGLCRKPKCLRPPGTLLPLFCSLGEAGGARAEPPQNLPAAAASVQTVLPLKWSGQKRGAGLSNSVPRFRRRDGNGKNPDSQEFRVGSYTQKYYSALMSWIGGTA